MWLKLLPYAGAMVVGIVVGSFGTIKIANGLKTQCPKVPDCICKCPEVEPCPPAIDYDKMKARNIQVTVHQHNTVQMNADSLYFLKLEQLLVKKMDERDLVRVKRR